MKRRAKRDLGILGGAVLLIVSLAFVNSQVNRAQLAGEMDKLRRKVERDKIQEGVEIMSWDLMRKTSGKLSRGANFPAELMEYDGKRINIAGFMHPIEDFRDVTEFMLLPLPIECYFCQIPPLHDVMQVILAEGEVAQIYEEPVVVSGVLRLNQGPDIQYFYTLTEATLGPGDTGSNLTRRQLKPEHLLPNHEQNPNDLLPPYQPPSGTSD